MSAQVSVSQLFAGRAAAVGQAHDQHKHEEPKTNMGLPAGIENGIAQLWTCKIDVHKEGDHKGKPYFYADGRVKFPKDHNGMKCEGQVTKIVAIPLYDTPERAEGKRTTGDHMAEMQSALKLLTSVATIEKITGAPNQPGTEAYGIRIIEQYVALMAHLEKTKPYFRFRTWSGKESSVSEVNGQFYVVQGDKRVGGPFTTMQALKNKFKYVGEPPLVNHQWGPACEWKPTATLGSGVNVVPPTNGTAPVVTPPVVTEPEPAQFNEFDNAEPEPVTLTDTTNTPPNEPTAEGGLDLTGLATQAEAGDEASQEALADAAIELGATREWIDSGADNWQEVADFITGKTNEQPAEEPTPALANAAEPEPVKSPKRGEVIDYVRRNADGSPMVNPATKKPMLPVSCTVESVSAKNKTVKLARKDGKAGFDDVPWSFIGY